MAHNNANFTALGTGDVFECFRHVRSLNFTAEVTLAGARNTSVADEWFGNRALGHRGHPCRRFFADGRSLDGRQPVQVPY